ncbi:MAG: nucleoside hydrolase [Oscillospiraceae bacterium]|nr:nucleoside hydrolase [Oscillospiraceae bacterium]
MTKAKPVIIDTDPGVDDAFAIMLAAASERLEIVGLCSVDGNVKEEHTARNALDLAEFLSLGCPVARGAAEQLEVPIPERGEHIHGERGMGEVRLPKAAGDFDSRPAWDFIYDKALEYAGELVLIAIGPLTNIALLLQKHPDVKPLIKQLVVMGGSTTRGNRTPFAEFNFWADPPAARLVFESGLNTVMAGLNITLETGVPLSLIDELSERPSRLRGILKEMSEAYSDRAAGFGDVPSSIVHDAVAVFYAAWPELCETRRCEITINTEAGGERWGQSLASCENPARFNAEVIEKIDMERYLALYGEMIDYFA